MAAVYGLTDPAREMTMRNRYTGEALDMSELEVLLTLEGAWFYRRELRQATRRVLGRWLELASVDERVMH